MQQVSASAPLCQVADIPSGNALEVRVERGVGMPLNLILLRAADGTVRGYLNVCPHQGRALNFAPKRFLFTPAGELLCAAHGAVFEVEQGICVNGPCKGAALRSVALQVRDDAVYLAE